MNQSLSAAITVASSLFLLAVSGCSGQDAPVTPPASTSKDSAKEPNTGVRIGGSAGESVSIDIQKGSTLTLSDSSKSVTFSIRLSTDRIRKSCVLNKQQPTLIVDQSGKYVITTMSGDGTLLLVNQRSSGK